MDDEESQLGSNQYYNVPYRVQTQEQSTSILATFHNKISWKELRKNSHTYFLSKKKKFRLYQTLIPVNGINQ